MSSLLRWLCLASCAVLLAACFGGQTGQEGDRRPSTSECKDEDAALERTEISELGFSAADLEAQLDGGPTLLLTWWNGASTELALELLDVRARTLRTSEQQGCVMELDVLIAVTTADGLLDETLEGTLSSSHLATWSLNAHVPIDMLRGELRIPDLGIDLSKVHLTRLSMLLRGAMLNGIITLDEDDADSDDEVPAESYLIAGAQWL